MLVDDAALDQAVAMIAVLADRNRLGILAQLHDGELPVGEVQRRMGIKQALTSHHVRVLFAAGLVRRRRAGLFVYYALDADGWAAARSAIEAVLTPAS
jgi:DNA-binding transcriptional ArsR family regulator